MPSLPIPGSNFESKLHNLPRPPLLHAQDTTQAHAAGVLAPLPLSRAPSFQGRGGQAQEPQA